MSVSARENPFEVSRVESLITFDPALIGTDWASLVEKFKEQEFRAVVSGPHGSGKTTFLRDFAPVLTADTGLLVCPLFLNDEKPCLTPQEKIFLTNCPNHGSIVIFLDGEEQMHYFDRLEFTRIAHGFAGLLTTKHFKKRSESVLLETETTPEMLQTFITQLMPDFPDVATESKRLFAESSGNIREALGKAYDMIAANQNSDSTGCNR